MGKKDPPKNDPPKKKGGGKATGGLGFKPGPKQCWDCKGTGMKDNKTCPTCDGSGEK